MEINVTYNNIDWVIIIDDYDYIPEQKESGPTYDSGGEPGYPETIEVNDYSLELCSDNINNELVEMINAQLAESDKLKEHIFDFYAESIHEEALELHHEL